MKNTFVPELRKTRVRKILESLVERIQEIDRGPAPNQAYRHTYKDIAFEEAEEKLKKHGV